MSEVILKSNEIVKHFGQTHALNGISIEVRRGEIIGLIGENGSGKSTFLQLYQGLSTNIRKSGIEWKSI